MLAWCAAALVFGCAASPRTRPEAKAQPQRPPVDRQAMSEAMRASRDSGEHYASSASYAHFLKARVLHHAGEHRRALDELRLALVTDDGNPYLLVAMAEEYARVGDLARAERTLRRVIDSRPRHARAHFLMGRVLAEGRKLARARVHLQRAVRLSPEEPEPWFMLAQVELDAKQPDQAIAAVESMAKAIPDESRGFRLLGQVFAERGDARRAERMLVRATEVVPADTEAWGALAELYDATDRPEKAERAWAEALSRDGDDVSLLLSAARTALKLEQWDRARAWFDRALSVSDEPETAVRVAFAWLRAERVDDAVGVLERARARPGAEPRLAYYLGLLYEKRREFSRAAEAYAQVPALSEVHFESRMRRAASLSLAGEHGQAVALFRRVSSEQPENVTVYPPWARALERAGSVREAEKLLRTAVGKWKSAGLYDALAQNLQRQGRAREAASLLETARTRWPEDKGLVFTLANAWERLGEPQRAIALMREVLAAEPDEPSALNFIGYVLADHNLELDEAERLVRRALELRPDSGAFLDSLGWVHYRKGETQKAVEVLERAAALEPNEPVILEHLGDAYLQANRLQDAAQAYRRALEVLQEGEEPVEARALRASLEKKLKGVAAGSAGR